VLAARAFLAVVEHWDRVGDATQQWLNLRYVARLLQRVGATTDAAALHAALVAAGKPSPLGPADPSVPAEPREPRTDVAAAVTRARAALDRVA
jgi:hypothetical protein